MYSLFAVLVTTIVGIITFFKWRYTYWKRKNVPCIEPSIPFGSTQNPFTRTLSDGFQAKNFYNEFKKMNSRHGGFYNLIKPIYLPIDPELIKNIIQNDFTHFMDRGFYYNEEVDPLSAHLFAIRGERWRSLRAKLTPTFSSGKMKAMFDTLVNCSKPMKTTMDKLTESKTAVDVKEIVARYTTDIIGSCAFGLECNSFAEEEGEFRKYGKRIFQRHGILENLKFYILHAAPDTAHFFKIPYYTKDVRKFFLNAIKDTVNNRKKNGVTRNDMLQLLIDMKDKNNNNKPVLSVEEMAAQAMIFFIAGYETSSTTMSFCLLELAQNPDIQEKVRSEIKGVLEKHNNEITYDALTEMKYLTQVIEETLRKYPALTVLLRECVKDYQLPDGDKTIIEKGTKVFIPVLGLHHDAEHYPEPDKFDPERFSEENKKSIHPFAYLPFGEGPRICIGLRFGMMQTKIGLSVLLKNYRFSLSSKMKFPIEFNLNTIIYTSQGPIWLDTEKVN